MVFTNTPVDLTCPINPIKYVDKKAPDHPALTLQDIIKKHAPQFVQNADLYLSRRLFNGHLQTVYTSYMLSSTKVLATNTHAAYYRRLVLNYNDGGEGTLDISVPLNQFVSAAKITQDLPENVVNQTKPLPENISFLTREELKEFTDPKNAHDTSPLVLILHGLTGGSNEAYVTSLVQGFQKKGVYPCVLNSRGCAFSSITTPILYNGFWTDDVRFAVDYLKSIQPERKIYLVGISLGASVLTNYLGQEGDDSKVELGVGISVPWDMILSWQHLDSSMIGKVYSKYMKNNCVELLNNNIEVLKTTTNPFLKLNAETFKKTEYLRDFDNNFTAKMFGFNSAGEYYRHASCVNRLFAIRTPYIGLNSTDDPILGPYIPADDAKLNPFVNLVTTQRGGHVGWILSSKERWFTEPIVGLITGFHKDVVTKDDVYLVVPQPSLPIKTKTVFDRLIL
ncbi:hypothetical protein ACO0QE_002379 [Hanseniaspora vineae]